MSEQTKIHDNGRSFALTEMQNKQYLPSRNTTRLKFSPNIRRSVFLYICNALSRIELLYIVLSAKSSRRIEVFVTHMCVLDASKSIYAFEPKWSWFCKNNRPRSDYAMNDRNNNTKIFLVGSGDFLCIRTQKRKHLFHLEYGWLKSWIFGENSWKVFCFFFMVQFRLYKCFVFYYLLTIQKMCKL